MSSMVRRIQRTVRWTVNDVNGDRVLISARPHYMKRGATLGVHLPVVKRKGPARGSRRGVQTHLKGVIVTRRVGPTAPRNRPDIEAHRNKMKFKRACRTA